MKKRISFKLFCSVIWRGLCQPVVAFLRLFGYQGSSTLDKVMWRIISTCLAIIMLIMTYFFVCHSLLDIVYRRYIKPNFVDEICTQSQISADVAHMYNYRNDKGFIYNDSTKKRTIEDIDWICVPYDGDTLAVFAQNGKRGYFNKYTGEIAIPALYTRAWVFSQGLAAVEMDNKKIVFINRAGDIVIDKNITYNTNIHSYVFKDGYCLVSKRNDEKMGLIDLEGNWALSPQYDMIMNTCGFWLLRDNGREGLLSANLDTICSVSYPSIFVNDDYIALHTNDKTVTHIDYDGYVIEENVVDDVMLLEYDGEELLQGVDEDGDFYEYNKKCIAKCRMYQVNWNGEYLYGLMDTNGDRITPAIYDDIEAIENDLYLCYPHGYIINGKGQRVK